MDDFRKEVIKELERMLGDGYQILPYDKLRNNEISLHGICIHHKDENVSPIMYLEEYILPYAAGIMNSEEIARELLEEYHREEIPRKVADHVDNFHMMKDRIRIKIINYDANTQRLKQNPHRRFLDLAIAYYLDMEICMKTGKVTIGITNELMKTWGVSEEDLYRVGMENMSAKDSFYSDEMVGIVRKIARSGLDEDAEKLLKEIEKEDGTDAELYVASNRKRLFGACCLVNKPFLQELAERTKGNLLIYPINVTEILIYPMGKGNKNCMSTKDMQKMNKNTRYREECLSNSIYLYDRTKQELSIYKKGEPL